MVKKNLNSKEARLQEKEFPHDSENTSGFKIQFRIKLYK